MIQTNAIAILLAFSMIAAPIMNNADIHKSTPDLATIIDQDIKDFTEQLNNGTLEDANYAMGNGQEIVFTTSDAKMLLLIVGAGAVLGYAIDGSSGAGRGALLGLAGGLGYMIAIKF